MQSEDLIRFVWGGCSRGKFFVVLGRGRFFAGCGFALGLFVECDSLLMPYTCAEIPPAGAPSGFDSAAFFDFIA